MRPAILAALAAAAIALPLTATAQVTRTGEAASPIAATVSVPAGGELVFLSGALASPAKAGDAASWGDTEAQTASALAKIGDTLKGLGLGYGDVVKMTVFLAADPAKGGKMDFAGLMKSYNKLFGTPEQPNKPARSTVQVAALVAPGALVEIEVIAARAGK